MSEDQVGQLLLANHVPRSGVKNDDVSASTVYSDVRVVRIAFIERGDVKKY